MDNYYNLQASELTAALAAIQQFKDSPAYKAFQYDYGEALKDAENAINFPPSDIQSFFAREQAFGQVEQIRAALSWFDTSEAYLSDQIEKLKEEDDENIA